MGECIWTMIVQVFSQVLWFPNNTIIDIRLISVEYLNWCQIAKYWSWSSVHTICNSHDTLSHTIFYYAKFSFGKRGPSQSILGNLFETIKSCESCYFPQNKLFMLISYKKCIAWKSKVYVKDLYMIIFKQSTYLHSPTVFIIRDMY